MSETREPVFSKKDLVILLVVTPINIWVSIYRLFFETNLSLDLTLVYIGASILGLYLTLFAYWDVKHPEGGLPRWLDEFLKRDPLGIYRNNSSS